jgi:hypothetical protein
MWADIKMRRRTPRNGRIRGGITEFCPSDAKVYAAPVMRPANNTRRNSVARRLKATEL